MLKFRKSNNEYYISTIGKNHEITDWLIFYFGKNFKLSISKYGYFDNRPNIRISLLFFTLVLNLPIYTEYDNESREPTYGIAIHNNSFWVYKGLDRHWIWDIPYFTVKWKRTSILLIDNTWLHNKPGKYIDLDDIENKKHYKTWYYNYIDSQNVEVPAIITVKEKVYCRKWFKNLETLDKTIEIKFTKGVASNKGRFITVNYELKPNEHPLEAIERFRNERNSL